MGTILTMTLAMMTAAAVTREFERGTMENLLAMPVQPLEVMLGKIIPYVFIGFVQVCVILVVGIALFDVAVRGQPDAALGLRLRLHPGQSRDRLHLLDRGRESDAGDADEHVLFMPSMLLSGFLFPFRGMPAWAQWLGELLPLTHFLRIIRGLLLKGIGLPQIWPELWPVLLFMTIAGAIALWALPPDAGLTDRAIYRRIR